MAARVRDFLYLDHTLVAQSLSQLDFGVFKEWEETLERASGKEGRAGLSLWGAANVGAGATSSKTAASTVVLMQTAESYAARLLLRLEEEDQITALGAGPTSEFRRGSIVLCEGIAGPFEITRFESEGWAPAVMAQLSSLIEEAEELAPAPETVKAMVLRTHTVSVVAPLLRGHLRVPVDQLLDDAVEVLASVRRIYRSEISALLIVRPIAVY